MNDQKTGVEDDAARAGRSRGKRTSTRWVVILGAGFALLVGWSSPTFGTFLFLGAALLVLGLLLALSRLNSKVQRLSVRVRPEQALLVTTFCLCFVLAELSLRLFLFQSFPDYHQLPQEGLGYRHDASLGWFPVPNSEKTLNVNLRTISIAHNSKGFRDPEPSFDARPGVVFLGDSFTWGYNVDASERFTEQLRVRHPEWQIYNFGVTGYGTDQEYLLLQRNFQEYHPRVVFLIFCTENDYIDNCSNGGGKLVYKPYFTLGQEGLQLHGVPVPISDCEFCLQHPLLSKPYLIRLVMRAWGNLRCPAPAPRLQKSVTPAIVQAINQYVLNRGSSFCVGLTSHDAELEQSLEGSKIPYLDLSNDLRVNGDFHWSGEGHAFVAEKIDQFLVSRKFF